MWNLSYSQVWNSLLGKSEISNKCRKLLFCGESVGSFLFPRATNCNNTSDFCEVQWNKMEMFLSGRIPASRLVHHVNLYLSTGYYKLWNLNNLPKLLMTTKNQIGKFQKSPLLIPCPHSLSKAEKNSQNCWCKFTEPIKFYTGIEHWRSFGTFMMIFILKHKGKCCLLGLIKKGKGWGYLAVTLTRLLSSNSVLLASKSWLTVVKTATDAWVKKKKKKVLFKSS